MLIAAARVGNVGSSGKGYVISGMMLADDDNHIAERFLPKPGLYQDGVDQAAFPLCDRLNTARIETTKRVLPAAVQTVTQQLQRNGNPKKTFAPVLEARGKGAGMDTCF